MSTYSKILITGANGQLGQALYHHSMKKNHEVFFCDRAACDLTQPASIENALQTHAPNLVINCGAYTAVDQAENDRDTAMKINQDGTRYLAEICEKNGIFLIHISTDYVFDGTHHSEYVETDRSHPINVYGESKWLGEEAIRQICEKHLILRVSGMFSEHGHNFAKTILRLARDRRELKIVSDQITCPTYAGDIASALYTLAEDPHHLGTYHFCSTPPVSWYDFAKTCIEEAHLDTTLIPIFTSDYPTAATRPAFSVLNCDAIKRDYGIAQPSWQSAIKRIIKEIA